MCSKKQAQKRHGQRRLKARFNLEVDPEILVQMIQNNEGEFIERQSTRITVWHLLVDGRKIRVVYDKERKVIVTALYPEEEYRELKRFFV